MKTKFKIGAALITVLILFSMLSLAVFGTQAENTNEISTSDTGSSESSGDSTDESLDTTILYTITTAEGTEEITETKSLGELFAMVTSDTSEVTIKLYSDIMVDETGAYGVDGKCINIDLNGKNLSNDGGGNNARIRPTGGTLNIYGGTIYSDNTIFIDSNSASVVNISNCTIEGTTVLDIRRGQYTFTNCKYTRDTKRDTDPDTSKYFANLGYCYLDKNLKLTLDNCEFQLGAASLINTTRGKSYPTQAVVNLSVNNSEITTTGTLLELVNIASPTLSSNRVEITGASKIICSALDSAPVYDSEGVLTNKPEDTVVTLGLGVMFSVKPELDVGKIEYSGGAVQISDSGNATYPYIITSDKLLYSITASDGTETKYYSEMSTNELVALAPSGSTIKLYTDIKATDVTSVSEGKTVNIDLNGFTMSNSDSVNTRINVFTNATLNIRNGNIVDEENTYFIFVAKNYKVNITISDCTINSDEYFIQTRGGSTTLSGCTVTHNNGQFCIIGKAGEGAGISFKESSVTLTNAYLVAMTRESSYSTTGANNTVEIENTDVTSDKPLFYMNNNICAALSYNTISILGDSSINAASLDGDTNTVSNTSVSLGLGTSYSFIPSLKLGNVVFGDGAKGIKTVEDADCPYTVVDTVVMPVKPYFSLTLYVDFTLNLCFRAEDKDSVTAVTVDGAEITPYISDGMVFYPISGIAAHNAAESKGISILFDYDGFDYTVNIEYSVIDYASGLLSSDYSDESKQLLARTLEYIAEAYKYVGVEIPENVSTLMASESYTSVSDAENLSSIPESTTSVGEISTVLASAQINLDTNLRFRFNIKDGVNAELSVKSATVDETYVIENGLCDGKSYIEVGIRALDMYNGVITFTSGDAVGTYDLKAYANSSTISSADKEAISNFMLALYNYCREAKEYAEVSSKDFKSVASVVVKDGKAGAVSYVIDDGNIATAENVNAMASDYSNLKLTFALIPKNLVTLTKKYNESTEKYEYVFDENGKYTYEINESNTAFWKELLDNSDGKYDYISHSMTHAFWGLDDNGGVYTYVKSNGSTTTSGNLPVGSASAEIYAATQVLNDLFGLDVKAFVEPGIGAQTTDVTIDEVTYTTYYTYYRELLAKAYEEGFILSVRAKGFSATDVGLDKVITPEMLQDVNNRLNVTYLVAAKKNDVENWKKHIDNAAAIGGWSVFCLHEVIPDGETSTNTYIEATQAKQLFEYSNKENIWVANYTEAMKYYTEWSSAKVSSVYDNGTIKVTLTDGENDELYNEALTVKVTVPYDWTSCTHGGSVLPVMVDESGNSYVYVDIVPDSGVVTLTKGN